MSKILESTLAFVLLALCTAPLVVADHHESASPAEEAAAPSSGFRADFLWDLTLLEKKVLALAEATPADQYSWAPTPEVRSLAASYVHMAQANHQILQALGVEAPEGTQDMESEITEKDDVEAALEASFAAVRKAAVSLPDSELDTQVEFFGRKWSKRQALMLIAGHCHEHLGQAIVYARSVGVTPPWSLPRDSDSSGDEDSG